MTDWWAYGVMVAAIFNIGIGLSIIRGRIRGDYKTTPERFDADVAGPFGVIAGLGLAVLGCFMLAWPN